MIRPDLERHEPHFRLREAVPLTLAVTAIVLASVAIPRNGQEFGASRTETYSDASAVDFWQNSALNALHADSQLPGVSFEFEPHSNPTTYELTYKNVGLIVRFGGERAVLHQESTDSPAAVDEAIENATTATVTQDVPTRTS